MVEEGKERVLKSFAGTPEPDLYVFEGTAATHCNYLYFLIYIGPTET